MLNASGHILLPEFFSANLRREGETPAELSTPGLAGPTPSPAVDLDRLVEALLEKGEKNLHAKVTEAVERFLLVRVLRQTHGHLAQASDLLGLNRATLRTKLRALGLAVDKTIVGEDKGEEIKNS
jgi:two-component system nitrogen regulation response regulator GlnG